MPKQDGRLRFIEELRNEKPLWRFEITGFLVHYGHVVDFMMTSDATPITIMVEDKDKHTTEIPWVSIQKITHIQGEN
jgi:hypothetical protein